MNVRRLVGPAVAIVVCLAALAFLGVSQSSLSADGPASQGNAVSTGNAAKASKVSLKDLSYKRVDNPEGTKVVDGSGKEVARFTDTARTAVIQGKERTIEEPQGTDARVTTTSYVRVMPQPYTRGAEDKAWFQDWFAKAIEDEAPDALEVGTQYFANAEDIRDENGLRIAGDADFGPENHMEGDRKVGSDFNDFLEIKVAFPDDSVDRPEKKQRDALDSAGFLRMVYGYRLGYPMYGGDRPGEGLQRQVDGMYKNGPGVLLAKDTGAPPPLQSIQDSLLPGDVLMFTNDADPGLDHAAIYLGRDDKGHHRFMSSREANNGPTMGDVAGASIIDGQDLFATNFRAVRRI